MHVQAWRETHSSGEAAWQFERQAARPPAGSPRRLALLVGLGTTTQAPTQNAWPRAHCCLRGRRHQGRHNGGPGALRRRPAPAAALTRRRAGQRIPLLHPTSQLDHVIPEQQTRAAAVAPIGPAGTRAHAREPDAAGPCDQCC